LDDGDPMPDPASRAQPDGVHGASEIVDATAFAWSDEEWSGVPLESLVLYELHVGTFTPEGTLAAAAERLEALRDLGITAVELMPLADFPGGRNWGYDGAALFAPARCYGTPLDVRRFVARAHDLGLAVHLDVVFNHLGPDGAYLAAFAPAIFSAVHRSPWGAGINLDGPGSEGVRAFFIECALHWVHEYHLDGLRIDATHALVDESPRHFLADLADRLRATPRGRNVLLIAEDARNLAVMVRGTGDGGWGMDGVWSDDFHHQMRRILAGDRDGYFIDFSDRVEELAATINQGWFYTGQVAPFFKGPRGTDPSGIPAPRFVICLQNHDQVGNRAHGDRLHHTIPLPAYRAASAVLLCAPQTPLLFMGQEWGCSSPFQFFTDHAGELGELVRSGRAREFEHFAAFADASSRARLPDPQAVRTFERSRLDWSERERAPHQHLLQLYADLLERRRSEPALAAPGGGDGVARALDPDTILLRRGAPAGPDLLLVSRLRGAGDVALTAEDAGAGPDPWYVVLDTEDPRYAPDPRPIELTSVPSAVRIRFQRPGAVLLRRDRNVNA
jgi:maltooligosyltrehalose trehalohydrolase